MNDDNLVDFKFGKNIVTGTLIKRNQKTIIVQYKYMKIKRHIFKHKVLFLAEKIIDSLINNKKFKRLTTDYRYDGGTNVILHTDGTSDKWYEIYVA
jgi:hypothetical protein|tara:strand:+ start:1263 stop:1550 length:288 start_codon:yes stop_codon:yes gene_type:complete